MKSHIKNATLLVAFAVVGFSLVKADDPPKRHPTAESEVVENEQWGLKLTTIPRILRQHLPMLESDVGVVVNSVKAEMFGDKLGIQPDDLILQVDGGFVRKHRDLPKNAFAATVMRHGRIMRLDGRTNRSPLAMGPPLPMQGPMGFPGFAGGVRSGGVSASSFAGGNESVSVSRSGNQISLNMSLPELTSNPIRLRGTPTEILRQVQDSKLPSAAKQRVLDAIRQNQ